MIISIIFKDYDISYQLYITLFVQLCANYTLSFITIRNKDLADSSIEDDSKFETL